LIDRQRAARRFGGLPVFCVADDSRGVLCNDRLGNSGVRLWLEPHSEKARERAWHLIAHCQVAPAQTPGLGLLHEEAA
jgi:hypothetical protein